VVASTGIISVRLVAALDALEGPHYPAPMHLPNRIAGTLAALMLAPAFLGAQTAPDSGTFIVRHSGDTVATERFSRTQTSLQGTLALRNAKRTSQRYNAVVGPDATLPLIEVTVREDADSGRVKSKIVQRARVIFKNDSAAVDDVTGRGMVTQIIGTRAGAVPYLNLSFALLEQAIRRARAQTDDPGEVAFFNLGGGQTVSAKVSPLGSDSLTLDIGKVEYHLRVDPGGRVLGGRIPAQDLVAERQ
jgi:hypothetical protein